MSDQTTIEPGSEPLENHRYEAFAVEYVANGGNGTQAALKVGYAKSAAHVTAHRVISDAKVSARVDYLRRSKLKALHMSADETLAEIAKIARASMGEVLHVTPDGDPYIDLSKASPEFLAAIERAEIEDFTDGREVDENGETIKRDVRRVKVKMASKLGALQTIAKHHGLLTDKVEVTVSEDFAETMMRARERARKAREGRNG